MRFQLAFFALGVTTVAVCPSSTYAHVGLTGSPRVEDDAAGNDKILTNHGPGHRIGHEHGGGQRELGHGVHGHEKHGGGRDSSDSSDFSDSKESKDHHGGRDSSASSDSKGSKGRHRGHGSSNSGASKKSKGRGARVTGGWTGSNRMHIQCKTPDPEDTFVVDLLECHGDCCEDENYCGEFKVNLETNVSCEEDENEDSGWNCGFDFKIPEDFELDTTEDEHGYRVRITDLDDESFQACTPPIDMEPEVEEDEPCVPTTDDDSEGSNLFGTKCKD